jgi:hypothetical protein
MLNESNLEDMLLDDDIEHTMVIVIVKNLQDRLQIKMRRGSIVCHICIPQNSTLGHASLMQDYFSEVSTYLPSLPNAPSLFAKIVQDCEANCRRSTLLTRESLLAR